MDSLEADKGNGAYSTAARYQMIGDALRGKVTDASMIDISSQVREAIENEPVPAPVSRPVRAAKRERKPLFDFGAWLRPVGGLAVAATVAMVMVVTLTDQQSTTDNPVVANVGQQPVQALPVNNAAPVYPGSGMAYPAVNLKSYLTQHSEYAAQDTIQGVMPYARSVSYGSESHPSLKSTTRNTQTVNNPGK